MMKKLATILFSAVLALSPLCADVRSATWAAVQRLSESYRKAHPELLFQKTLALFTPVAESASLKGASVGPALAAFIKERLSRSTLFALVERENLDKLMGELELGLSGAVDPESAPEVGQLLGAELLLTGSVTELGDQIQLALQLVDASTGRVEAAETVAYARQEILASAQDYVRSSFQSPNGIFITPELSYLMLTHEGYLVQSRSGSSGFEPGKPKAGIAQLQAGYRFLPFLSAGLGGTVYTTMQFNYDPADIVFSDASTSARYVTYSAAGVNAFAEAYISPGPRLNLGLRAEGILYPYARLVQDIISMPVMVPDWTDPANPVVTRDIRRVEVAGYALDDIVWGIWLQASAEYLVSQRLALTFKAGYYYQPAFWPAAFRTDSSVRADNEGADLNGSFPEYLDYDFARQNGLTSGPKADFDPKAITFALGLSLQL
jgi:TolB-like protein